MILDLKLSTFLKTLHLAYRIRLPDLNSSVQEQFIRDLRSDNLTELTVPSVCESDTPSNPHDTTVDVLSFEADVSLSSPQEHSTVTFKDSNFQCFRSVFFCGVAQQSVLPRGPKFYRHTRCGTHVV